MKIEWRIAIGVAVFLGAVCAVYWFWTLEPAGTAMLLFGMCAYLLMGGYLILGWLRRRGIPRPEDRPDATQADGAGAVAFFPSASMWPVAVGLGATFVGVALVFGSWYWLIAMPLIFGAIIGWVVESEQTVAIVEQVPPEQQWPMAPEPAGNAPNPSARDEKAAEAAAQATGAEVVAVQDPAIVGPPMPGPGEADEGPESAGV